MKIIRSTKCSLKYTTKKKRDLLNYIRNEYSRLVNMYIDIFWEKCPHKMELMSSVLNNVDSKFSYRLKLSASREAVDIIMSHRKKEIKVKPVHKNVHMCLTSQNIIFDTTKKSKQFDAWLHVFSIGNKIIFDVPIKFHKHYDKLNSGGKRLNSYIITKDHVQFCFEIETGPKKEKTECIGIDTGIKSLATSNTGRKFGEDIEKYIKNIERKGHNSKAKVRARRALKQRIDEVVKEVVQQGNLIVVEKLKKITKKTKIKRRLNKNMRRSISNWNVMYWLNRLQQQCEWNRVSFRSVSPFKTSQMCSVCGYADRKNRRSEKFLCQECGHSDDADVNAAKNILHRFLTGPYGAGCKPKVRNGSGTIDSIKEDR